MFLTSNAGEGFSHGLQVIWTKAGGQPKTLYNSPDVQVGAGIPLQMVPSCRASAPRIPQKLRASALTPCNWDRFRLQLDNMYPN